MDKSSTLGEAFAQLHARQEAERRRLCERHEAQRRTRIIEAAGIELDTLSDHGQLILDWLASSSDPTIDGIVELISAARMAVYVECHRADIADKNQAVRDSSARLDAAMARYDTRFGTEPKGVEL